MEPQVCVWPAPSRSGLLPSTHVAEVTSPRHGLPVSRVEVKAVGTFKFPYLRPAKDQDRGAEGVTAVPGVCLSVRFHP